MCAALASDPPLPSISVDLPRCSICTFEFVEGDQVIVVEECGRQLEPRAFVPRTGERPPQQGVVQGPWLPEDWNIGLQDLGCHADCLAREHRLPPPRARFQAMAYNYYASPADVARRERWLRMVRVAPALHRMLARRFDLPLEVCEAIAEHCCVRVWAAAESRAFWDRYAAVAGQEGGEFDISRDLWASHVEFEGVRYIAHLTNEHPRQGSSYSLIHSPVPGMEIDTLYMAEDYFGVRELHFVSSLAVPALAPKPGVWWKRLVSVNSRGTFITRTDGTKLRCLSVPSPNSMSRHSHSHAGFEQPRLPTHKLWWFGSMFGSPFQVLRMDSFVCNGPATVAYSVCYANRPYTIRAHTLGERDLSFYATETRPERYAAVWLHMPVGRDERITEMWVRIWTGDFEKHAAFIIRTNQGRTVLLGSYPTREYYGRYEYTLLHRAGDAHSRIFFDISLLGIDILAFETPFPNVLPGRQFPVPLVHGQHPPHPVPDSPCPSSEELDEAYFHSSAVLDGVNEIFVCRTDLGTIIGLLLRYQGGYEVALGQVRLDKLQKHPINVSALAQLWLHFSISPEGCPNVETIGLEAPTEIGPHHFPVLMEGRLEWWFSYRQCRLWHNGLLSPPTVYGKRDELIDC